jgi:hypothetical protein
MWYTITTFVGVQYSVNNSVLLPLITRLHVGVRVDISNYTVRKKEADAAFWNKQFILSQDCTSKSGHDCCKATMNAVRPAVLGPTMKGTRCRTKSEEFQVRQRLRWSRGSVLAFSTQVRGFKPGRRCRNFKAEKILSTPSSGGEVKPSVPCRRFAACKRTLNVPWKSII